MKIFCLRLALFLLLGGSLIVLCPQKALAKDSYGFTWTWTAAATPSATVVDSVNNVYYAGFLASSSAPIQMNPNYSSLAPGTQINDPKTATTGAIFITKIASDHLTYDYTYIIEADDPLAVNDKVTSISLTKIATDSADNVFLLGTFNGKVNFNTTGAGPLDFHSSNGENWQFLTKIMADGSYGQTFIWQSPYIALRDIAFDKLNDIFLTGIITDNTGGDISVNLDPLTETDPKPLNDGDTMVFWTSIAAGTPYAYNYSFAFKNTGLNHLEVDHIALDSNDNVFLLGTFSGSNVNFDGTGTTDNQTSNGLNDIYLTEYDSGGAYIATHTIGGAGSESAGTLAIDSNNNIFYSGGLGNIGDNINLDPIGSTDPKTVTIAGQNFLTRLTNDGATYSYSLLWNTNSLKINKIAFDSNDLIYLIGESSGTVDYNPATGDAPTPAGGNNAFMTVLNYDGSYNYTYVWGGDGDEKATDAAFDSANYLFIAGSTTSLSINFDPTGGSNNLTPFTGGENGYVTEFSPTAYTPPTAPPSTDNNPEQNNNNNSNSGPSCGGSSPSAPSIFQIWATKNTATIHFVPSKGSQDTYTVSYGPYSGADTYNVTFNYSDKSGAIPYTVNALGSGTIYYFKVRGNNGCMPGGWSNTLSLRTAYSVGNTSKAYSYNASAVSSNVLGASCSEYTVVSGDSFWSIAQKLLGAGTKYFQLWNANKARFPSLNSSSVIRTGWTLSVGC